MHCCVFDRLDALNRLTLYIYRMGWTYPARNPFIDLNLQKKSLVVLGLCLEPIRPVTPTGKTGRSCQTGYRNMTGQTASAYRSDRSTRVAANFGRQHVPSCSLAKIACQRTLL